MLAPEDYVQMLEIWSAGSGSGLQSSSIRLVECWFEGGEAPVVDL